MTGVRTNSGAGPQSGMKRSRLRQPLCRRLFGGAVRALCALLLSLCCLGPDICAGESVSAKAAVVIDGSSGRILFAKNPHLRLPPASTTKLVTAMVALDRMAPDTIVTISGHAAGTPSVSPRLRQGERFTVRDLLCLSLMRSVNGAAVALAEAAAGSEDGFVTLMNEKTLRTGAENTRFVNASGLPGEGQSITAYELAGIMKEALSYPLIRDIISMKEVKVRSLGGRRLAVKNTNSLLWSDEDLLGGKTGYTRAARHCFVCAAEKGQNTIIVALLGESARGGLWHETSLLLEKGQDVLAQRAEPMISLSSPRDRVVLASYTPRGSGSEGSPRMRAAAPVKKTDSAKAKRGVKSAKAPSKKARKTAKAPATGVRTMKS